MRLAGKGKRLIFTKGKPAEIDDGLVGLLAEAFAAKQIMLSESRESQNAMTKRLNMSKGYLTKLARLSYLSPQIIRDCLAGRQPIGLNRVKLLKLSKDLPCDWPEQREHLGFPS